MVDLLRMMKNLAYFLFAFVITIAVGVNSAHAFDPPASPVPATVSTVPAQNKDFRPSGCGVCSGTYSSEAAAASAARSQINAYYPYNAACGWSNDSRTSELPLNVHYALTGTNANGSSCVGGTNIIATAFCATGTLTADNKSCTGAYSCPSGYTLSGTTCNPPSPCVGVANDEAVPPNYFIDPPENICKNGCVAARYKYVDDASDYWVIRNGVKVFLSKYGYTYVQYEGDNGLSCTSVSTAFADNAPPPTPEDPNTPQTCGENQTGGTVNGVFKCVDKTTGQPTAEATPPAPTTTTTTTTTNPDNSTTETTTTVYNDNSKTVVIKNTTASGTTTTKTQNYDSNGQPIGGGGTSNPDTPSGTDINKYCQDHPNVAMCKETSEGTASGGAACDVPPTCDGDAIACATLNQSWRNRCQVEKTNKALGEGSQLAADLEAIGEGAMTGADHDTGEGTDLINVGSQISTQKFLTGGCLPDKVISGLPMGKTLTIPFSSLCPYLEIFGNLMIIMAMFSAARIVGVF